jgi:hypothetical protein
MTPAERYADFAPLYAFRHSGAGRRLEPGIYKQVDSGLAAARRPGMTN